MKSKSDSTNSTRPPSVVASKRPSKLKNFAETSQVSHDTRLTPHTEHSSNSEKPSLSEIFTSEAQEERFLSFEEKQDCCLVFNSVSKLDYDGEHSYLGEPFGVPTDRTKKGVFKTIKSSLGPTSKKCQNQVKNVGSVSEDSEKRRWPPLVGYSTACRNTKISMASESEQQLVWTHDLNKFPTDPAFERMIAESEKAFEAGVHPILITQGSSGSYFVSNVDGQTIGVFKPADEEPYGHANPKWGKYIQRKCCPCCFGRGCLISNHGYLSETGASIVDERLKLGVVPKTRCVMLANQSFNNSRKHARKAKKLARQHGWSVVEKSIHYPPKIGSYQTFVNNYKEASHWLKEFEKNPPPPETERKLKLLFDRMVILDYVIRNTDRGYANWLLRYDPDDPSNIYLAAIDNGLAFPFKHPNQWRGYPFSWTSAPQASKPFETETKDLFLPVLNDMDFVEALVEDLRQLFMIDRRFTDATFENQMEVLRGQIQNLCNTMVQDLTLAEMAELPRIKVVRALKNAETPFEVKRYVYSQEEELKKPCFKRC